jgi:hypothetical protein
MKTNLRFGHTLLAALLTCGLVACTSSDNGPGGTGGTVTPGGTGGTSGPTTSTVPQTDGEGTLCPPPLPLLTDFTYTPTDAGALTAPRFGSSGHLTGGMSPYPTTLTSDLTQGNWHITGTVNTYAGFNLYFDNCDRVDASKFTGLSFTVSGTVPSAMTLSVGTVDNTAKWTWMANNGKTTAKDTDVGKCAPTQDTQNQYYAPGCTPGATTFAVTATATPVSATWATLTGGAPNATVNPAEITSVAWIFPWVDGQAPYQVDFTIDDISFLP